jgi:hypothetical protein
MVSENSSTYLRRKGGNPRPRELFDWSVYRDTRGVYRTREYSVAMPGRMPPRRSGRVRSHAAPSWQAGAHAYNRAIAGLSGGAVAAIIVLILLHLKGVLGG